MAERLLSAWVCAGFVAPAFLAIPAPTRQPDERSGCREPFRTADLVRTVCERWGSWTLDELRGFWPDALATVDVPVTEDHLPTLYAHFVGDVGACGEIFRFTPAIRGNPQYLESVELRIVSESLEDADLAGKELLRAFGGPFRLLGDAFDEWSLDDAGRMHRDYTWEDPRIRVDIDLGRREGKFQLEISYERETILDRPPPSKPDAPIALTIFTGESDEFVPLRSFCVGTSSRPTSFVPPGASRSASSGTWARSRTGFGSFLPRSPNIPSFWGHIGPPKQGRRMQPGNGA